ncbi:MAG TPA: VanW family protein [Micromonosporaceae bacterium]|nr:VanW family protein [Micromonosporaceae bacterium]
MNPYGEKRASADDTPTVQLSAVPATAGQPAWASPPGGGSQQEPARQPEPPADNASEAESSAQPSGRGRRRALLAAGIAAAVLVAATGTTAAYAYRGDVPHGTTVLDVKIGGKGRTEASAALRDELARRADTLAAPVTVKIGDQSVQVLPADVGLMVNVEATVAAAEKVKADPISRLFGSRTVEPVVEVDAARLNEVLQPAAAKESRAATMPAITFAGTVPKPVYPKPGTGLDPERSAAALRESWLQGHPVVVPLVEIPTATTAEEVDRLLAELAKPAVAAPVTVTTDRGKLTISPNVIAKSLILTADKTGKIKPRIDEKKLRSALAGQLAKVEVQAKNATISIVSGKPKIAEGADGQAVDVAALSRDLLAVLPRSDGREVEAKLIKAKPKLTAEQLAELGIKERVSTFTTHFTGGLSSPRSKNIVQISKQVNGTIVLPGKVFSLNGHTGERSYAQGYHDAPVIIDGKLVPGVGGGNSQFTTTLFNAIYYAGLEDVEHKPHSYWFSRYPPVIESTIFYPDLDFKFRNNTQYGVLIETSYTSNSVTVSIWGTKIYDSVKTEWSSRRNITKPKVIYLKPGPSCIATNGIDGFTQDAWRIFIKDGKEVRREKFTWTYQAEPRYICAEQPS